MIYRYIQHHETRCPNATSFLGRSIQEAALSVELLEHLLPIAGGNLSLLVVLRGPAGHFCSRDSALLVEHQVARIEPLRTMVSEGGAARVWWNAVHCHERESERDMRSSEARCQ